jgi:hypothetical protein
MPEIMSYHKHHIRVRKQETKRRRRGFLKTLLDTKTFVVESRVETITQYILVSSHDSMILTMAPLSIEHDNFLPPSYDHQLPLLKKDVKKPSSDKKKKKKNVSKLSPEDDKKKKEKQRRRRKAAGQPSLSDIALSPRVSPKPCAVSFAPIIRFKPVTHIDDFTHEQIEDIWFTEYDLNVIRADCVATVRNMVF